MASAKSLAITGRSLATDHPLHAGQKQQQQKKYLLGSVPGAMVCFGTEAG
jgi:hypothetical protein